MSYSDEIKNLTSPPSAIERPRSSEPALGARKLSVSLPPELRREVRQIAFDCECSETSVVEIALRLLLGAPDVRTVLLSYGTRYRRTAEPASAERL
jgi:hypothetical protein